ncbi:hypothetical protein ACFQ3S_09725 [Mucilaginibacter terrae]|uniref:hypothetical protein n=1 Tax=Mucilaginibacter terrae TaxID=1955052 RepID=UPI003637A344
MKIISFFIAFAILIQINAIAQSNYKVGYIIKSSGDTLKGYINYKEWENSPSYIEYKAEIAGKDRVRFYPGMLRGFVVSGMDKYISYAGPVSVDKNIFPDLTFGMDTTTVRDTVFLRMAYEGSPLSLLTHQDDLKVRIFIQDGDKTPAELRYYQYYTDGNTIRTVDKYKTQILLLAQKYNWNVSINRDIEEIRFSTNELERLLKAINKDSDHKTSYKINGNRFFAAITLNRTITQFGGENTFSGIPYTSYLPKLSAGYNIFANKFTQKFFLRTELAFGFIKPRIVEEGQSQYIYSPVSIPV